MSSFRSLGVLLLVAVAPFGHALAAPTPSLVDSVARLDYGQARGRPRLLLKVDGLDAQGLLDPTLVGTVRDLGVPAAPPRVGTVEARELPPAGSSSRTWLVVLDVTDVAPNTTQPRWLQLVFGGKDVVLSYTLTNAAAVPFSWTVKARPVISISSGEAIPVSVTVGPVPARAVTVLESALVERVSKVLLAPRGLKLCRSAERSCSAPVQDLPPNTSAELWLVGATGIGVFEGTVALGASEKPAGDSFAVTVNSSTTERRMLGILVILVAVVIAWAGTVLVRHRINRAQLEMPASLTRIALNDLDGFMKANLAGAPAPRITAKIAELLKALQISALEDHGLPGSVPAVSPSATALETYRSYVKTVNDWTVALGALVRAGLTQAWATHQGATPGTNVAKAANDALVAIDGLVQAGINPPPPDIQTRMDAILVNMRAAVAAAVAKGIPAGAPGPATLPSPEELRVTVAWVGLAGWAFILLATVLSGAYALVLGPTAQGFGTPIDFLVCALWGLGLPTGAQLLQATTTSVATTFGVPK